MAELPLVSVEQGYLQGRIAFTPAGKPYYSFQGIPYAKPPIGPLRFLGPQPVEPWDSVRDATSEGSICPQTNVFANGPYTGDEDCLFLNVYSPKLDGEPLAVMVFIHGGIFRCGSGNSDVNGPDFLVEKGVLVVTLNYRCGPLGFLCLNTPEVPGNAGLKDIVAALRWVKKNISKFGGNPDNLTIFGESAGGAIVSLLTASPLTKDLISKAIIQSGTCLVNCWAWQRNPIANARVLAKELGCESEDVDDILDFLREESAQAITEAYNKLNPSLNHLYNKGYRTVPVIEKEFPNVEAVITQPFIELLNSGKTANIPIMIGTTDLEICFPPENDDLKVFIPEEFNVDCESSEADAIADAIRKFYFKGQPISVDNRCDFFELISDRLFKVPTYRHVKYLSNVSTQPIYVYIFDYFGSWNVLSTTNSTVKRATHKDDNFYLFRNIDTDAVLGTNEDKKIRERMVQMWTNFAKKGDPTPNESHFINVSWAPISKNNFYYLRIANELSLHTDPEKERVEFWEELYNKYFKIWEQPKSNGDDVPINSRAFKNLSLEENNENEADEADNTEITEDTKANGTVEPKIEINNEDQVTVVEDLIQLIKSSDPPEDDLPKNIGVDKFVNYYESLGSKSNQSI